VTEVIEKEGFELVELAVVERGHRPVVRVYADRRPEAGGSISVDECARLSNKLSDYFDLENVFERAYILEVSSPGLDRFLTSRRDFERKKGRPLRLWVEDGVKTIEATGELSAVTEEGLRLCANGEEKFFPFTVVKKGREII